MTIRAIVINGDPVLHTPTAPVERFDDELRQLVDDMFDTMDRAHGVGLASVCGCSSSTAPRTWTILQRLTSAASLLIRS